MNVRRIALARAPAAVLGLVLTLGIALPAAAESLGDALVTAWRNSPEIAGARANLKVLSERAVQARASVKAGELEVRAAELAFEGENEEAKVAARTTIEVLDAEQEVLNARADLVRARRDEYVAAYTLLAAIGKRTMAHRCAIGTLDTTRLMIRSGGSICGPEGARRPFGGGGRIA